MDQAALQAIADSGLTLGEAASGPESAPQGQNRHALAALALPLVLQTIANGAALVLVDQTAGNWIEWAERLVLATAVQLILLATWLFLGTWSLGRRCILVGVGLAVLLPTQWLYLYFRSQFSPFSASFIFTYIELGAFASVAAVAWYFRRVRAWRLAPIDWPRPIPPARPLRFSLRHMFIATAVAGALMALRTDLVPVHALVSGMVAGMLVALLYFPAMVLLLGTARRRMTTLVDAGLLLSAAGVAAYYTLLSGRIGPLWVASLALAGSLVWLRICGIRLIRGPSEREARDQQAI